MKPVHKQSKERALWIIPLFSSKDCLLVLVLCARKWWGWGDVWDGWQWLCDPDYEGLPPSSTKSDTFKDWPFEKVLIPSRAGGLTLRSSPPTLLDMQHLKSADIYYNSNCTVCLIDVLELRNSLFRYSLSLYAWSNGVRLTTFLPSLVLWSSTSFIWCLSLALLLIDYPSIWTSRINNTFTWKAQVDGLHSRLKQRLYFWGEIRVYRISQESPGELDQLWDISMEWWFYSAGSFFPESFVSIVSHSFKVDTGHWILGRIGWSL